MKLYYIPLGTQYSYLVLADNKEDSCLAVMKFTYGKVHPNRRDCKRVKTGHEIGNCIFIDANNAIL